MTNASSVSSIESSEQDENDLLNMVEEIGTAVAAGLVPFVGQAINIYDTIESLLILHNCKGAQEESEAKFDLVLALVGWIPGAGSGVKKTIRIVNKNPARYAPILFDVLRMVCLKLGIQTSPETLLEKLFDAAGLKVVLGTAQASIENSWAYEQMPSEIQATLSSSMATVRSSLPNMVMLVTRKLMHWKRMQRNNAARSHAARSTDVSAKKPAAKDTEIAKRGADAPTAVSSNGSGASVIGATPLSQLTNEVTGMLGEHITDYFLYEEYGWGKDWDAHDRGASGSWRVKPDSNFPGKINEGTKLNPLLAVKAHGVGIDGVWKVQIGDPKNDGKRYAIVESKASSNRSMPVHPSRKPQVSGKLMSNSRRLRKAAAIAAALPKTTELLDPSTDDSGNVNQSSSGSGKPNGSIASAKQKSKKKDLSPTGGASSSSRNLSEKPIVQMSHAWIIKNIGAAVKNAAIEYEIRRKGEKVYARHLFYTPFYLPSAAKHAAALRMTNGSVSEMHKSHIVHSIPSTHCYNEYDVKAAVNKKHKLLKLPLER